MFIYLLFIYLRSPENQAATSMCYDPARRFGIARQQSVSAGNQLAYL